MGFESGHHRRLYDAVDPGPVRYILLTQGHVDHVGGVDTFREPGTLLVAQANNPTCQADDERIHRFRVRRSQPYWAPAIAAADAFIKSQPKDAAIPAQSQPTPDVLFDDRYDFDARRHAASSASRRPAARRSTRRSSGSPSRGSRSSATCSARCSVTSRTWSRCAPTACGSRSRSSTRCRRVIDLEPEILCTGHFDPIVGRDTIRTELTRVRDAVQYVHDATVAGMNEGKDVFTLMREIRLPDELAVGEGYGKVSWGVRSIWEGYAGWFHARSTTELYATPPDAVSGRGRRARRWPGRDRRPRRGTARPTATRSARCSSARWRSPPNPATGARSRRSSPPTRCCSRQAEHGDENFWLVGWLRHQIAGAASGSTRDRPSSPSTRSSARATHATGSRRSRRPGVARGTRRAARRGRARRRAQRRRPDDPAHLDRRAPGEPAAGHRLGAHASRGARRGGRRTASSWSACCGPGRRCSASCWRAIPTNRPLMKWEGLNAIPPPETATFTTRPAHRGGGREAGGDLLDGAAAQGGALGARRRPDRVRGAAHPVVPRPGLARAVPHPVVHRVVPRVRHAARVRLPPAVAPGAAVPGARAGGR